MNKSSRGRDINLQCSNIPNRKFGVPMLLQKKTVVGTLTNEWIITRASQSNSENVIYQRLSLWFKTSTSPRFRMLFFAWTFFQEQICWQDIQREKRTSHLVVLPYRSNTSIYDCSHFALQKPEIFSGNENFLPGTNFKSHLPPGRIEQRWLQRQMQLLPGKMEWYTNRNKKTNELTEKEPFSSSWFKYIWRWLA